MGYSCSLVIFAAIFRAGIGAGGRRFAIFGSPMGDGRFPGRMEIFAKGERYGT